MIRFATPDSDSANAYFIESKEKNATWLLVFHEWWGLNQHIQDQAETLHRKSGNVNVLCLDLYDGKVANTRDSAAFFMQQMSDERAIQIILGARELAGYRARILTIGWCFGAYWAMKSTALLPYQTDACVMFYGMPVSDPEELKILRADVLAIFAEHDTWINADIRQRFIEDMSLAEKNFEVAVFNADHAFANPSGVNFRRRESRQANALAIDFLLQHIRLLHNQNN